MSWWEYATGGEKALIVVGVVALALLAIVVASPHVRPLQPIVNALGLVRMEVVYVPVPVNHTVVKYVNQTVVKYVYVNQTVPVYINRTVYVPVYVNATYAPVGNASLSLIESIAGRCAGDLVFLPNNTAWFVVIWLAPKDYIMGNPLLYQSMIAEHYVVHYNATTHYAQFTTIPPYLYFYGLSPEPASFVAYSGCYLDNVSLSGYYVLVCGDTYGHGPFATIADWVGHWVNVSGTYYQVVGLNPISNFPVFVGSQFINATWPNATLVIPRVNTTYTGVMLIDVGLSFKPTVYGVVTLGPVCNITVIYAPNPQAALYIELPLEYVKYWSEADTYVYGHYNPYVGYMGYQVWRYPS